MQFKLKVINGHLQDSGGSRDRQEIQIAGPKFVIGTAPDCNMRCSGQAIAPYHCIIMIEPDRVVIRETGCKAPTFVNDAPIAQAACLFDGDRLRIGRIQFGVAMGGDGATATPTEATEVNSTMADYVVDLLTSADEADRAKRRYDPAAREFRPAVAAAPEEAPVKAPKRRPPKRPAVGLPPPPDIRGDDTVDAANQALDKIIKPQRTQKKDD